MKAYQKLSLANAFSNMAPKPTFELSEEQIANLKNYSGIILGIIKAGGILSMAVLAPNALQALELFEKKRSRKRLRYKDKKRLVLKSFYYLKRQGHIQFIQKGDDYEVVLTDKGKKRIKRLNFETLIIPKEKQWDGKYWQVAADIPTKYKIGADAFREKIKQMQFYPLQRTLWFYPYDPRVEIEFIARTYSIGDFVTMMKIEQLDSSDERVLKEFFSKQGVI